MNQFDYDVCLMCAISLALFVPTIFIAATEHLQRKSCSFSFFLYFVKQNSKSIGIVNALNLYNIEHGMNSQQLRIAKKMVKFDKKSKLFFVTHDS